MTHSDTTSTSPPLQKTTKQISLRGRGAQPPFLALDCEPQSIMANKSILERWHCEHAILTMLLSSSFYTSPASLSWPQYEDGPTPSDMSVETWLSNSFPSNFRKENREKKIEKEQRKRAKKKSKDAAAMQ